MAGRCQVSFDLHIWHRDGVSYKLRFAGGICSVPFLLNPFKAKPRYIYGITESFMERMKNILLLFFIGIDIIVLFHHYMKGKASQGCVLST